SITIDVVGNAKNLIWTGSPGDGTTWDAIGAGGQQNWKDAATNAPETFFNLDSVTFSNGPTSRSITLNTTVTPGRVTATNDAGFDYAINGGGSITGATGLTKSGTGTFTLGTNNAFDGAISV